MQTKEKMGKSRTAVKRRKTRPADPNIVYTQPKPFDRRRFVLRMATVVAIVLALVLGMSIFFKVAEVTVSGTEKYTAWDVMEVSGIRKGENLLTLNKARIGGKIRTQLPYVESVRIGIKLPDTVNIQIHEMDVVYAIADSQDQWWLMDASGKIVDAVSGSEAKGYTKIEGVRLQSPEISKQAVAEEAVPATDEAGETVPVTVKGSERLSAVIAILQSLEENGVVGQAASVNVADMTMIELWYQDHYQVLLGDTEKLDYKIQSMVKAIGQQETYQRGILDVSFTTWGNQVNLSPFSE